MNGANKLACLLMASLFTLLLFNSLAYSAHSLVAKQMKFCEYSSFLYLKYYLPSLKNKLP
jgi:hypothetical protein